MLLNMINEATVYLDTSVKTYLGICGMLVTDKEYPKFVR